MSVAPYLAQGQPSPPQPMGTEPQTPQPPATPENGPDYAPGNASQGDATTPTTPTTPTAPITPDKPFDPQELLEQAKHHLSEAQRLHEERSKTVAPTLDHHKTGIGTYLTGALLAALDPTHQAGSSFMSSYNQAKDKNEQSGFQDRLNAFNQKQNILSDQAKQEQATGGDFLKSYQASQALAEKAHDEAIKAGQTAEGLEWKKKHEAARLDGEKLIRDAKAVKDKHTGAHQVLTHADAMIHSGNPQLRKEGALAMMHAAQTYGPDSDMSDIDWKGIVESANAAMVTPDSKEVLGDLRGQIDKLRKNAMVSDARYRDILDAQKKTEGEQRIAKGKLETQKLKDDLKRAGIKFPKEMESLDLRNEKLAQAIADGKTGGTGAKGKKVLKEQASQNDIEGHKAQAIANRALAAYNLQKQNHQGLPDRFPEPPDEKLRIAGEAAQTKANHFFKAAHDFRKEAGFIKDDEGANGGDALPTTAEGQKFADKVIGATPGIGTYDREVKAAKEYIAKHPGKKSQVMALWKKTHNGESAPFE